MRHWAEEIARDYLVASGYALLAENYVVRGGELDLVMLDGEELVFVEVRQRSGTGYGVAAETLDGRKLARLRRAAALYLARNHGGESVFVRFDAILIHGVRHRHRIEHLRAIG